MDRIDLYKALDDYVATHQYDEVCDIHMCAGDNAGSTCKENGVALYLGAFSCQPTEEMVDYWYGSVQTLLACNTYSDATIAHFAALGFKW